MLKGIEAIVRGVSMIGTAMIGTNAVNMFKPKNLTKAGKICTSVAGIAMTSMITDKVDDYIHGQFKALEAGIKAGIEAAKVEAAKEKATDTDDTSWEVIVNDTAEDNSTDGVDSL